MKKAETDTVIFFNFSNSFQHNEEKSTGVIWSGDKKIQVNAERKKALLSSKSELKNRISHALLFMKRLVPALMRYLNFLIFHPSKLLESYLFSS